VSMALKSGLCSNFLRLLSNSGICLALITFPGPLQGLVQQRPDDLSSLLRMKTEVVAGLDLWFTSCLRMQYDGKGRGFLLKDFKWFENESYFKKQSIFDNSYWNEDVDLLGGPNNEFCQLHKRVMFSINKNVFPRLKADSGYLMLLDERKSPKAGLNATYDECVAQPRVFPTWGVKDNPLDPLLISGLFGGKITLDFCILDLLHRSENVVVKRNLEDNDEFDVHAELEGTECHLRCRKIGSYCIPMSYKIENKVATYSLDVNKLDGVDKLAEGGCVIGYSTEDVNKQIPPYGGRREMEFRITALESAAGIVKLIDDQLRAIPPGTDFTLYDRQQLKAVWNGKTIELEVSNDRIRNIDNLFVD